MAKKRVRTPRRSIPRDGSVAELWSEIEMLHAQLTRIRVQAGRPRFASGSFTCPAADGTDQVVECPFALSALHVMVAPAASNNALHLGIGFAGVTDLGDITQLSMSVRGAVAGPAMSRSRQVTSCVFLVDAAGTTQLRGVLTEVTNDSFTINFTSAGSAFDVYWMAVG